MIIELTSTNQIKMYRYMKAKQKSNKFEIVDIVGYAGDKNWKARILAIGEFYKSSSTELDNYKYSCEAMTIEINIIDFEAVWCHVEGSYIDEVKLFLIRKMDKSELNQLIEIFSAKVNHELAKLNNLKRRTA